ncbi:MAG: PAS domain S-box protein, partial [Chloroflexi bacterium]|nr:PAS domain S-box protein [Chloroflexota bacterium]
MHSADSDPSNTDSVIDDLGSYLDSLPDPAIAVGQDGLIVDSNSLFLDLSGYGTDQIRHLSVESLVPGELRGAHRTYRSELPSSVRQRRMGSTLDLKLRRKDGSLCPVDISLSMAYFRGKRISIATARDMTERRIALAKEISSAADLLSDMGRLVGESRSLNDLYRAFSEAIHKGVAANRVSIISHAADDSFCIVESVSGTQLDGMAAGDRLPISGTLVGSVIATGEPILRFGQPLEELLSKHPGLSEQF